MGERKTHWIVAWKTGGWVHCRNGVTIGTVWPWASSLERFLSWRLVGRDMHVCRRDRGKIELSSLAWQRAMHMRACRAWERNLCGRKIGQRLLGLLLLLVMGGPRMELLYMHEHGKRESCCWAMGAGLIGSPFEASCWAENKPNFGLNSNFALSPSWA